MNSREARHFVRKFRLDDNTLLLVKQGSEIEEAKDLIGKAIKDAGLSGVIMLIVDDMDDVKVLNKLDMNRLGWYRLNDVRRLVEPRKEKKSESN